MSVLRSKLNWKNNIWIWKQCWFSPHYKKCWMTVFVIRKPIYIEFILILRESRRLFENLAAVGRWCQLFTLISSLRLFGPTMDLKGMDETNHEHKRLQNSTNSKSNMLLVKRPILVSVTYASLTESSGKTSETKHFQLRNKPQSGMLSSKIWSSWTASPYSSYLKNCYILPES